MRRTLRQWQGVWAKGWPKQKPDIRVKMEDAVSTIVKRSEDTGYPDPECFMSRCQSARFFQYALAGIQEVQSSRSL